jgi:hypothetical protein
VLDVADNNLKYLPYTLTVLYQAKTLSALWLSFNQPPLPKLTTTNEPVMNIKVCNLQQLYESLTATFHRFWPVIYCPKKRLNPWNGHPVNLALGVPEFALLATDRRRKRRTKSQLGDSNAMILLIQNHLHLKIDTIEILAISLAPFHLWVLLTRHVMQIKRSYILQKTPISN